MVVLVNGVALEEPPRDIPAFLRQYSHFKEQASNLCSNKTEVVGPVGLLYVFQREFGATHPHDNKISVIGTDDVTTGHIVIIRHSGIHYFTFLRKLAILCYANRRYIIICHKNLLVNFSPCLSL